MAIAKPGMVYPESTFVKLTRPSGSGNLHKTQQNKVTLVSL